MPGYWRERRPGVKGLTLIEVMCVLAITALVLGATWGVLTSTIRGITMARSEVRVQRACDGLARLMRRDVEAAYRATGRGLRALKSERSGLDDETASLRFYTTRSVTPSSAAPDVGLYEIAYVLRADDDPSAGYVLAREERPYTPGTAAPTEDWTREDLLSGVRQWVVRFHNGSDWQDGWDSVNLPIAIRLDVTLNDETGAAGRAASYVFAPMAAVRTDPTPRVD